MADNRQKGENRQRPNDAISEACPLSHSDLLFIEAKEDRHSAKQNLPITQGTALPRVPKSINRFNTTAQQL